MQKVGLGSHKHPSEHFSQGISPSDCFTPASFASFSGQGSPRLPKQMARVTQPLLESGNGAPARVVTVISEALELLAYCNERGRRMGWEHG